MNSRVHAFIIGRVQGVFFRSFVESEATSLDIRGWVRNLRDGRVEVLAEGDKDALDELLRRIREGSPRARVEKVDVIWEEYVGDLKGFRIFWL
ncbi:MAG: acylphosphatase [Methanocellales archaeon]|nr:acylphosphatase [Methanocellales archaeon]MDD3291642.1 acylphosphatase [Methanocellales archaeon]MDD5235211.1 acylphosphatase [Methanocellales archaeon]MDD5485425.1 acylphosphatase [Methanocellales archaeon]